MLSVHPYLLFSLSLTTTPTPTIQNSCNEFFFLSCHRSTTQLKSVATHVVPEAGLLFVLHCCATSTNSLVYRGRVDNSEKVLTKYYITLFTLIIFQNFFLNHGPRSVILSTHADSVFTEFWNQSSQHST